MTIAAARRPADAAGSVSLTEGLARILARPVPPELRRRAMLHLLDWIGCAVNGAMQPAGGIIAEFGRAAAAGPCRAIAAGRRDAGTAAFVNGAYGNVLEMDDIHRTAILHPGPVVIPAALALAERDRAAAAALLDAMVRGYEAMIRIGRSVGPGHYRHWHKTSTCGPFGAAAACASLLGLDRRQTVWALGNAGTQASGPWQCRLEDVMSKQLHNARAAQSGLVAAELARLGFTGPAAILEGPLGFYAAACPDPDPDAVLAEPDGPWLLAETSFKPWPACRHAHAAIDAALALRARVPIDRVARVVVRGYGDAISYCDKPAPATVLQAKFSLQHAVAIVLLDGAPGLQAFAPASIARPDVAALRAKVRVEVAEPFASAYPRHYGAGVAVELADGAVVAAEVPDALGDPENPVSEAAITGKARMLMADAGMDEDRIATIIDRTFALADGGAIADVVAALP